MPHSRIPRPARGRTAGAAGGTRAAGVFGFFQEARVPLDGGAGLPLEVGVAPPYRDAFKTPRVQGVAQVRRAVHDERSQRIPRDAVADAPCLLEGGLRGRPVHCGARSRVQVEVGHGIVHHDGVGPLAPDPEEDLVVVPHSARGHGRPHEDLPQLARGLIHPPGQRGAPHCHAEVHHEGLPGPPRRQSLQVVLAGPALVVLVIVPEAGPEGGVIRFNLPTTRASLAQHAVCLPAQP